MLRILYLKAKTLLAAEYHIQFASSILYVVALSLALKVLVMLTSLGKMKYRKHRQ